MASLTEKEKEDTVNNFKTLCCKASWIRKGRADYHCSKCDKDVTLHVVCLAQAVYD